MKRWFRLFCLALVTFLLCLQVPVVVAQRIPSALHDDKAVEHKAISARKAQNIAQLASVSESGRLDANSQVLHDGSYFDTYSFDGREGEQVTVAVSSDDFDAYVMLLDPDGVFIDHSDNIEGMGTFQLSDGRSYPQADPSKDSTNAFLIVTLPVTGTYQVLVNSRNTGEAGRYTVSWRQTTSDDLAVAPPNVLPSGQWNAGFDAESLEFRISDTIASARYEEAISFAEKRLELSYSYDGKYDYGILFQLNRLAQLHLELQRLDRAEALYNQALSIYENQPHLDSILGANYVIDSFNGLAEVYQSQGRNDRAAALRDQVSTISRQRGERGPDPTAVYRNPAAAISQQQSTSSFDLALLYRSQGRYDEAEAVLIDALDRAFSDYGFVDGLSLSEVLDSRNIDLIEMLQALKTSDTDVANILDQLAMLEYLQGRYSRAEALFEEALATFDRSDFLNPVTTGAFSRAFPDKDIDALAATYGDLALLYSTQNRYSEAESLLLQALQLLEILEFNRQSDDVVSALQSADWKNQSFSFANNTARTFDRLADLYVLQERYSEAETAYRKNLEFYQQQFSNEHPGVGESFVGLAKLYEAQNDIELALQNLRQGLDIEEYHLNLNLTNLTETQGQNYVTNTIATTDRTISLNLQKASGDLTAKQLALTTVLRRKGRILDIASGGLQTLRQSLPSDEQSLLDDLIEKRTQLSDLMFSPSADLQADEYRTELVRLEAEASDLETNLARRSADFRDSEQPVDIDMVQTKIPEDGVLVEYIRYSSSSDRVGSDNRLNNSRYAAYILFSDGKVEGIDLGPAEDIDADVNSLSRSLSSPDTPPFEVKENAKALYHKIMNPVRERLSGETTVFISPDSTLNLIPFEALVDESNNYLLKEYDFRYLTSGRDLIRTNSSVSSNKSAVLIGDPTFSRAEEVSTITNEGIGRQDRAINLEENIFPLLRGTGLEIEEIKEQLPDAQSYLTAEATEAQLKTVQQPRILHIATHGFFRPINESPNPLLQSGLVLAGVKERQSGGNENGILTALEVTGLNLSGTQLVVLSACETGLGELTDGEGVYGLRRAIVLAGAQSQVISLWKVDDNATKKLMVDYYSKLLSGVPRDKALRATQRDFLKEGEYTHPFYWAAFIGSGNWESLE